MRTPPWVGFDYSAVFAMQAPITATFIAIEAGDICRRENRVLVVER
jgi:hypothetical protein